LALIILNSCQLDRQLSLALQLKQLNLPCLLLLNMADEAKRFGVTVDAAKMAEQLGLPVMMMSAKYGEGYKRPSTPSATPCAIRRPYSRNRCTKNWPPKTPSSSKWNRR